jgi:hypothetical protein
MILSEGYKTDTKKDTVFLKKFISIPLLIFFIFERYYSYTSFYLFRYGFLDFFEHVYNR